MWNIQQGNKRRKNKHNVESNLKALTLSLSDCQEELFTNIHCIVPSEYLEAAVIRLQISFVIRTFLILGKHRLSQSIRASDPTSPIKCKWMRNERETARGKRIILQSDSRLWSHTAGSDIHWPCLREDLPTERKRERKSYCTVIIKHTWRSRPWSMTLPQNTQQNNTVDCLQFIVMFLKTFCLLLMFNPTAPTQYLPRCRHTLTLALNVTWALVCITHITIRIEISQELQIQSGG